MSRPAPTWKQEQQVYLDEIKKKNVFQRLIHWIRERERIRKAKESNAKAPWTKDPILQSYRFCNVRRMDDKVSRWLLENWYSPYKDHPNILAAVVLARLFNVPSTLLNIQACVFHGPPGQRVGTKFNTSKPPDWDGVKRLVNNIKGDGYAVFNNAYVVPGIPGQAKVTSVVDTFVPSILPLKIDTNSMQKTHTELMKGICIGSFIAGQIVADLRWAITGTWSDKNDWAPSGPGSVRGLSRFYGDERLNVEVTYKKDQDEFLSDLKELVINPLKALPSLTPVTTRLEAHDYQNCMCEFDKYERTLWGESCPKQKYNGIS